MQFFFLLLSTAIVFFASSNYLQQQQLVVLTKETLWLFCYCFDEGQKLSFGEICLGVF